MDFLQLITAYWKLLVAISTGLGGAWTWWTVRKKKEQESTEMLYDQLEKMKKKVILQVGVEVSQATTIAEQRSIIEGLKSRCPECYEEFMKTRV